MLGIYNFGTYLAGRSALLALSLSIIYHYREFPLRSSSYFSFSPHFSFMPLPVECSNISCIVFSGSNILDWVTKSGQLLLFLAQPDVHKYGMGHPNRIVSKNWSQFDRFNGEYNLTVNFVLEEMLTTKMANPVDDVARCPASWIPQMHFLETCADKIKTSFVFQWAIG